MHPGLFDTAWVDFSKGLGAPVGAVLTGGASLIEQAWRFKQARPTANRAAPVTDRRDER